MREYGQVQSSYWTHPDIQELPDSAKLIGVYLLTSHHTNGLGCFRMPYGYVSIDLNMGLETVREGFRNLSEIGFLQYCERTGYVLIPNFLKWNPIPNPNSAKARVREFEQVPSKSEIYPSLVNGLIKHSKYFDSEFIGHLKTVSERFSNGSETVSHGIRDNNNNNNNRTITRTEHKDIMSGKPDELTDESVNEKAKTVLEKLNLLAGREFRAVESNLKLIRARLREGYSVAEMTDVVAMKVEEWKGTKMEEYLRPATLFNAEKFNQYVGKLSAWRREKSGAVDWLDDGCVIDGEVVHG